MTQLTVAPKSTLNSTAAAAETIRSTDFWFEDGTVILQAGYTLYRLYRGFLPSRSTVFRDMFSIPQPVVGLFYGVDGCPVIQVHDTAKDFGRFLKALHQCGSYKSCPVSSFPELSSVLRLSDKYDVQTLRDSMLSILAELYPSTLERWHERSSPAGYRVLDDHIAVLNLARKMNILAVLPGVMYEICGARFSSFADDGANAARIHNAADRKQCAAAIPKLALTRRQPLGFLMRVYKISGCRDQAKCDAERLRWLSEDLQAGGHFDPLSEDFEWDELGVCVACKAAGKEEYEDDCETLWGDLPGIFGLPGWHKLLGLVY
ncbi:hypothetical protein C8J57DRAFT_1729056 [Mycena rebaudengoi]|nr:hypothetical protein C8J57DRAFT_1729056 [Mycena rebaudengoi]